MPSDMELETKNSNLKSKPVKVLGFSKMYIFDGLFSARVMTFLFIITLTTIFFFCEIGSTFKTFSEYLLSICRENDSCSWDIEKVK